LLEDKPWRLRKKAVCPPQADYCAVHVMTRYDSMNPMSKKIWWLVIITALLVICGCGPKKEAVVFSVGGAPAELAFWEELIRDFEKQSGISVELLRQPTDTDLRRQGLVVALNAGKNNPDVFLMDVAWLGLFVASDWLEPLDSNMDKEPFFAAVLRLVDIHQGELMALPVYLDAGLLYYRKDLLEQFHLPAPPKTWKQLLAYARTVQSKMRESNPHFYGFVWQGAQYEGLICNFLEFAGSKGGFVMQEKEILLDVPQNGKALAFMHDLIQTHDVSPPNTFTEMKEEETRSFFQAGNALFERNWPYAWALHQSAESPVRGKVGVAPLPAPSDGESVSTLGGWHIGLSRFSDVKPQGLKLVRFITSYETQKRLLLRLGWNPGRKDLYSDPEVLDKAPHFRELKAVFQNARPRPILPYYTQISEIAQPRINGVLAAKYPPKQALAAAQHEIAVLLERYRMK
jgi:multiple sugar transport system substrate-binding protein